VQAKVKSFYIVFLLNFSVWCHPARTLLRLVRWRNHCFVVYSLGTWILSDFLKYFFRVSLECLYSNSFLYCSNLLFRDMFIDALLPHMKRRVDIMIIWLWIDNSVGSLDVNRGILNDGLVSCPLMRLMRVT